MMRLISPCMVFYTKLRNLIARNSARIDELEGEVSKLNTNDKNYDMELQEAKRRLLEIERTIRVAKAQVIGVTGPGKDKESDVESSSIDPDMDTN